jgi:dihydrofolate synthase/folylpolyglutamate synthase
MQTLDLDMQTPAQFTSYEQALHYVLSLTDYERAARLRHHSASYDLSRMGRLCAELGNPQGRVPAIHVAGTKGKGSVTTMAAYLLAGGGLRVGVYTSPHLVDVRERISVVAAAPDSATQPVAGQCISQDDFVAAMNRMRPALDQFPRADHPTFFELMTALAFTHFAAAPADISALEVGLGGRLDATNVATPLACAITSIGLDHTAVLGETLELIAAEKAGIIKPGVPAISSPQPAAVERVIRGIAAARNAPVWFVGKEIQLSARMVNHRWPRRWELTVRTPARTLGPMLCPLLGRHQATNLAVALGLVDRVIESGLRVDVSRLAAGLERTVWPGRLEVRGRRPWFVLDGAHTVESLRAVLTTLPETFNYRRLIVVVGCMADKDLPGMMGQLANCASEVVLTRSDHPHSATPADLAEHLSLAGPMIPRHVQPSAADAVALALRLAGPEDLVLVTGSLYLVGLVSGEMEMQNAK